MRRIKGTAFFHEKTKAMAEFIPKRQIAVIKHKDIDVLAAESLVKKEVKAVVNVKTSMSGDFFQEGVKTLLKHNIPVFDVIKSTEIGKWIHNREIEIAKGWLYVVYKEKRCSITSLKKYDTDLLTLLEEKANRNMPSTFKSFCQNSFLHAEKDLKDLLYYFERMQTSSLFKDKDVLIAVRGTGFEKDLKYASKYLWKNDNLVSIAVDGAADTMVNNGRIPDYIIGDMDSASDQALRCGAELLVHQDIKGNAPGMKRIKSMGLQASSLTFVGLSEDAAIAFALRQGADKIFFVGGQRDMDEYLGKGREGMGSSLLMKMFAGSKIIDLKGIQYMNNPMKQRAHWTNKLYAAVPFLPNPRVKKEMGDIQA